MAKGPGTPQHSATIEQIHTGVPKRPGGQCPGSFLKLLKYPSFGGGTPKIESNEVNRLGIQSPRIDRRDRIGGSLRFENPTSLRMSQDDVVSTRQTPSNYYYNFYYYYNYYLIQHARRAI